MITTIKKNVPNTYVLQEGPNTLTPTVPLNAGRCS